ncbi:MAG: deoxyribose-phosphate aldolase [Anaerolineaceae bacterium]|nr:deoxyribose-phosphate aldolase [Anaerolineaceae bacterium]MDD4042814.1 deoxyribose-phosphate aldolase [Anaerolineaceae bacterium]
MTEKDESMQIHESTATYKDQQITTYFDKNGNILRVQAKALGSPAASRSKLAGIIDHTLLKPDATAAQIDQLCREAITYGFGAVCVNGYWVKRCKKALLGSQVKVASVVGFPLGAMSTKAKREETKRAIKDGAVEIDMVLNVGELKSGNLGAVARDIREVVLEAHKRQAIVKVIIETCLLTDEEKVTACLIAMEAEADFVKTSTGFSTGGATMEDVALMRSVVGDKLGVKASGGIRTYADAMHAVEAGANRIGASSGIKIVEEELAQEG